MSCGLRNECTQENCHRCKMSEDGRTMFVQSEKFFNFDAVIEIEKEKSYQQGRADAFNEILKEMEKSPFANEKATFVKKYIEEHLKENKND